jgi:PAS domain S-box-containing protein
VTADHRAAGIDVSLPASALDSVPLGIAKINGDGKFTYANREMLRIAALADWRDRSIDDIFRGKALETVRAGLRKRFEQRAGSAYLVDLTRADDTVVPINITGFPETDANDVVIGSLALVRDRTLEEAQQSMVKLIESEADNEKLLAAIASALLPIVPYDRLTVLRLNAERTHLRTIFLSDRTDDALPQLFRWWCIPESIRPMLDGEPLRIDDLHAWYQHPERSSMMTDPAVQQFLAAGFVSTMSLPVSHKGAQVASLVLARKKAHGPFSAADEKTAEELPLTEAVSVALRNEAEGNLKFMLDLIGHISAAHESVAKVAQTIADQIARHYGWDDVSIYQAFKARGEIGLIAARRRRKTRQRVPEVYPIRAGIVGHVHRHRRSVNIGNVHAPEWEHVRIERDRRTQSELCVPIGDDARWLLNIEDEALNAFAPEEQRDLELIADGLSQLLRRTLDSHYRAEVVERAKDAILLVDGRNRVFEANPAAVELFRPAGRMVNGQLQKTVVGRQATDFFAEPAEAEQLLGGDAFPNREVRMRRCNGETVRVLLSIAKLPDETGRVLVASDLSHFERAERLELAQGLYREVVGQVKTPMSLAISWLRRRAHSEQARADDSIVKAVAQLQKAELTLDRLMLVDRGSGVYPRHEVLLSIDGLLDAVWQEMPERDQRMVDRYGRADGAHVRADAYELRYCIQTVLSYLVRLAAEDDRITFGVDASDGGIVVIAASGRVPECPRDIESECRSGQARVEMGLGRETLALIAARNHGRYTEAPSPSDVGQVRFAFSFPVALDEPRRP